jgi:hypothetical protein
MKLPLLACVVLVGCTKAQAASDVDKVLTATQIACVDGEAAAALTPAAPDLPEIEAACSIAQGLESLVLQAIDTFASERLKAMVRHAERAHP